VSTAETTHDDDAMMEPPFTEAPVEHPLWAEIKSKLKTVYDPEIPVNIYELGLIYRVSLDENANAKVEMSLTAPGCPVAGEMPAMVQDAVRAVDGVGNVDVELVWDPPWDPSRMADTAKLQLNMY
jgi:FeS assembly SUF system protein